MLRRERGCGGASRVTFQMTRHCHSITCRTSTSLTVLYLLLAPYEIPMPEAIPSVLAPYVDECLNYGSLTLITSTLSTPSSWLVVRYLNAALKGAIEGRPHGTNASNSSADQLNVVIVSILQPVGLWAELAKKVVSPQQCQLERS